jgi:hypothetical protein
MSLIQNDYPLKQISAALWSSSLISPLMLTLDMSIIRSHIKTEKIANSFLHVVHGLRSGTLSFWRPYRIMNQVYFSTFGTANLMEYYSKRYSIKSQVPTVLATSTVNIILMSYKDREYSHYFGIMRPSMSWKSRMLSAIGAYITVYGQFVKKEEVEKKCLLYFSPSVSMFLSSIIVSMGAQLFSTPFHILSMDLYQSPTRSFSERIQKMKSLYGSICLGRMLRIFPAFGCGGYLNEKWKREFFFDYTK